ncbi:MAG: hypothetical protein FJX77_00215 [Armatimonadetes bacterium]|nr:hypothetical protein [Armatimonadota bacterium]
MRGTGAVLQETASRFVQMVGRAAVGGLCGVGFLWTLTAVWPVSRFGIHQLALQMERLSSGYPVVAVGLFVGIVAALLWQSVQQR